MNITVRHIAAAYLLLLTLLKLAAIPLICLDYQVNKDAIAAVFCENRARPAMKCFGKCQLNKQLARHAEAPSSSTERNAKTVAIDYFEVLPVVQVAAPGNAVACVTGYTEKLRAQLYTGSVFHPPLA